ncbi:MAG: zinc ribbon domain-containing protein [Sedimentibacter sp.]|uniref:zinc ribbon domain-containing protein n=1 Tax=Sedimentibacter sp. TaxID=1960295 RepID=UPI0031580248
MFFMAGVFPQKKELNYNRTMLCSCCQRYGRYQSYMESSVLNLFFIPVFKFNKKVYIKTTCCNSIYLVINKEKASLLEHGQGEDIYLGPEDLQPVYTGNCSAERCPSCGFEADRSYKFCPNCGTPLK